MIDDQANRSSETGEEAKGKGPLVSSRERKRERERWNRLVVIHV